MSDDTPPIEKTAKRDIISSTTESLFQQSTLAELGPEIIDSEKQRIRLRRDAFTSAVHSHQL